MSSFVYRLRFDREDCRRLGVLSELEQFSTPTDRFVDLRDGKWPGALRCLTWALHERPESNGTSRPSSPARKNVKIRLPIDYRADFGLSPKRIEDLIHEGLEYYFSRYRNSFGAGRGRIDYWPDLAPRAQLERISAEAFRNGLDHRAVRMGQANAQLAEAYRILREEANDIVATSLPTDPQFRASYEAFRREVAIRRLDADQIWMEAGRRLTFAPPKVA